MPAVPGKVDRLLQRTAPLGQFAQGGPKREALWSATPWELEAGIQGWTEGTGAPLPAC